MGQDKTNASHYISVENLRKKALRLKKRVNMFLYFCVTDSTPSHSIHISELASIYYMFYGWILYYYEDNWDFDN